MDKLFRLHIQELDPETNEVIREVAEEKVKSVAALYECDDGVRFGEMVVNTSIEDIAHKICQSRHFSKAVVLALAINKMAKMRSEDEEEDLLNQITGGGFQ